MGSVQKILMFGSILNQGGQQMGDIITNAGPMGNERADIKPDPHMLTSSCAMPSLRSGSRESRRRCRPEDAGRNDALPHRMLIPNGGSARVVGDREFLPHMSLEPVTQPHEVQRAKMIRIDIGCVLARHAFVIF